MSAKEIWDKYSADAEWDIYDYPDSYTAECSVSLSVYGYCFFGRGALCCGEKEIAELFCTTPEGAMIKIV